MQRLGLGIIGLVGLVGFVLPVQIARAAEATTPYGGNNASDYQPQTDNPQSNVSSSLQNTGSGLQPTSGQTGLSQQTLNGVRDLQVIGTTSKPNPNTTSTTAENESKKNMNQLVYIAIGVLAVGSGLYVARRRMKRTAAKVAINPAVVDVRPEVVPEPLLVRKKPKKTGGKKPTKKKSTKKRKSKR